MKPFKILDNTQSVLKVSDTNILDFVVGLNPNTDFSSIKASFHNALDFHILPYLGEDLFNSITSNLDSDSKLLRYLRHAVAEYAVSYGFTKLRVIQGNAGVMENKPNSSDPSPMWANNASKLLALLNGDRYMDLILAEAETATGTAFTAFRNTETYKSNISRLFKKTLDLHEHLNIMKSRRTFEVLLRYIKVVEDELSMNHCADAWIWNMASDSDLKKRAMNLVKRFVANKAFVRAAPFISLVTEADGFKAVSFSDSQIELKSLTNNNHSAAIAMMINEAENSADACWLNLRILLKGSPTEFPEWAASPCNSEKTVKERRVIGGETGGILLT